MTPTAALFPDEPTQPARPSGEGASRSALPKPAARVLMPNRNQLELRASDLESLVPPGHRARLVWGYVERQNLEGLYAGIKALEGGAGRAAIAPEILYALWLYATLEGVGHARGIARLTQSDDAYRWICGGVQVNYHTLADFRSQEGDTLDDLLTDNVASLMAAGAVKLKTVAQDGMRVRASAGAASFRREERLKACLETARQQVATLKAQLADDLASESARKQAARLRAVSEREARIEAALARQPELAAIKKQQGKDPGEARSSTTDADATIMKMGDGGFRPAFNFQYASDTESQVIIGVEVVTAGSDQGQMSPMVEQVSERCGQSPENWLVDGGYPGHGQIDAVAETTTVYAPVPKAKNPEKNVHQAKPKDSPAVAKWRERMGSDAAKLLYRERAATAECVNALARNRGLNRLQVRGLKRVKGVALLFALAHNLMRAVSLAPQLVGIGTGTSVVPQVAG
ncbi:MAG: IS1182 family transposase [Accumulibacter sp.]|uniref:IS1182 family transposase n=1 Tax=Accumulibacter sp. TaxID=2053492 RepID=UPI002C23F3ED|nr:IS1182 family transposase [Rhodocyclaceae bacterium]HNB47339.1 IS1182 family transposase [Burkholderiaceae bacterium]